MNKELIEKLSANVQERRAYVKSANDDERKMSFVFISKNNAGERYDWWEGQKYIEEIDIKGVDFKECNTFFKDHDYCVDNAIGRIENIRIENEELVGDVIFGEDEESKKIYTKYKERILTDVSVGYFVNDIKETKKKGEPTHVLITKAKLAEVSAVWRGFDRNAKAKRDYEQKQEEEMRAAALAQGRQRNIDLKSKSI
jgi:hypothetical protein